MHVVVIGKIRFCLPHMIFSLGRLGLIGWTLVLGLVIWVVTIIIFDREGQGGFTMFSGITLSLSQESM